MSKPIPQDKYVAIKLMHEHVLEVRMKLDELYNILTQDEYYRLRQLLEEAANILRRNL